jgi:SAM-dependent methyltransferase
MVMGEDPYLRGLFKERYRIVDDPAMLRVELASLGTDYGASSYTTIPQADLLSELLNLGPADLLLDVGSGTGWPAIHVAKTTGCRTVMVEPTYEGMAVAASRASQDSAPANAVVGHGDLLPLRYAVFDAAISSDVMC